MGSAQEMVLLYDGQCALCRAGSSRLMALAHPGAIERADSSAPGALDRFVEQPAGGRDGARPVVTPESCRSAMQLLVRHPGEPWRAHSGVGAVLAALDTRRVFRLVTWIPRLPGVRSVCDRIYALVARHRHRLNRVLGAAPPACDSDQCRL